jgi:hypothetical protein
VRLSAPKKWTFIVGAVIWILGVLGLFLIDPDLYTLGGTAIAVWLGFVAGSSPRS